MTTQAQKAAAFRALHERDDAFIMPSPWDAGTARLLTALGFEALATTSLGLANTLGRVDGTGAVRRHLDDRDGARNGAEPAVPRLMKLLRLILFACSTADIIGKFEQLARHALTKPRVAELRDAVILRKDDLGGARPRYTGSRCSRRSSCPRRR